jgi:6-phosphogluconolactonase
MMNSNIHLHGFKKRDELVEILAQTIADDLRDAIATKGSATLLVSGGSTPKPLFETLRKMELGWENVTVGLCDERWVDPTHPDSNELLVKSHLLREEAAKADFSGLYIDGLSAEEAEKLCSEKVEAELMPIDVLVLGMGGDAHTASLFPNNSKLNKGLDLDNRSNCIAIKPDTAPHWRMSLTRRAILSAAHLYLHFEGEQKLAVCKEAMDGEESSTMPIRSILKQKQKDVEVYYA